MWYETEWNRQIHVLPTVRRINRLHFLQKHNYFCFNDWFQRKNSFTHTQKQKRSLLNLFFFPGFHIEKNKTNVVWRRFPLPVWAKKNSVRALPTSNWFHKTPLLFCYRHFDFPNSCIRRPTKTDGERDRAAFTCCSMRVKLQQVGNELFGGGGGGQREKSRQQRNDSAFATRLLFALPRLLHQFPRGAGKCEPSLNIFL